MAKSRDNVVKLPVEAEKPNLTAETVLMDADTAREWRTKKHFERQRLLSPDNIRRLSGFMKAGTFTPGTPIYICVLPNDAELIVNGNHTLEAICACGIPQWLTVIRHWVDDINQAGVVYATFDQHKRRTLGDSFKAYGVETGVRGSAKIGAAINAIIGGFVVTDKYRNISHADTIAVLGAYQDDALPMFFMAVDRAPAECRMILTRGPVMGVALETLRYQPSLAAEFWEAIARDSGLKEKTPEHSFLRFFRNNPKNTHRPTWARAAVLAWNAKFRGDEVTSIRPDSLKNFIILGTPHDKGVVRLAGVLQSRV